MAWSGQHFLSLDDLGREDMIVLMQRASHFLGAGNRYDLDAPLAGKIIANLFMENSTRTRCSFTIATKRLGGDSIDLLGSTSSASKGETLVDTALNLEAMGVAGIVIEKRFDLLERWRQTGQIVSGATNQGSLVSFFVWLQAGILQLLIDELINRIPVPLGVVDFGDVRYSGLAESPVFMPLSALLNPFANDLDVFNAKRIGLGRHPLVLIFGSETFENFAFTWLARHDCMKAGIKFREGRVLAVELQPSFSFVRTMTGVAMLRQNRLDLPCKVDRPFRTSRVLREDHRRVNRCDREQKTRNEHS